MGLKDGGPDRWVSAAGCLKERLCLDVAETIVHAVRVVFTVF